ncbi:hypothetical protein EYF80_017077 [Liparis tanakae]|uniref:Uncharacterized protein n=1 Tax=Liparis tanakae TaxID=230148 RepID=A0A4Z2I3V8_9TELE|nr:hypothetical protein EYF80_017077 [Liparis tanakae]
MLYTLSKSTLHQGSDSTRVMVQNPLLSLPSVFPSTATPAMGEPRSTTTNLRKTHRCHSQHAVVEDSGKEFNNPVVIRTDIVFFVLHSSKSTSFFSSDFSSSSSSSSSSSTSTSMPSMVFCSCSLTRFSSSRPSCRSLHTSRILPANSVLAPCFSSLASLARKKTSSARKRPDITPVVMLIIWAALAAPPATLSTCTVLMRLSVLTTSALPARPPSFMTCLTFWFRCFLEMFSAYCSKFHSSSISIPSCRRDQRLCHYV